MSELLTAAQMRAIEAEAMASGAVSGLTLMERAGRGVVEAIFAAWPALAPAAGGAGGPAPRPADSPRDISEPKKHAVVLCGPGNNGGDGFVIARLLRQAGWAVEVFLYGEAGRLPPDAAENARRWREIGEVRGMEAAGEGARPDLLIDAMFGIGLSRPVPLVCAAAHRAVRKRPGRGRCRVVAVDCPSGFDADCGGFVLPEIAGDDEGAMESFTREVVPRLLHADLCVTFHRAKVGHWLDEVTLSGRRPVVVDIGLGEGPEVDDPGLLLADPADSDVVRLVAPRIDARPGALRAWLRTVAFDHIRTAGHKYDRGHVLVLGGGPGRGGAGRLAARAALRIGAGLVTLGVPGDAMAENAAQLTAVMLREIGEAGALRAALDDPRLSAICLGPGLGLGETTREMVLAALERGAERRVVLDADALSAFAEDPEVLFEALHPGAVLTPHEGEFARLFPDLTARPGVSKVARVRDAAARAGCTILLKGPATVIASPDGSAVIHAALYDRAVPWLGTAGAGDVLAGMIAGLLAHGMGGERLSRRVEAAAWLHAEAARRFGPGLIAEDLPETLPLVLRDIGL